MTRRAAIAKVVCATVPRDNRSTWRSAFIHNALSESVAGALTPT
jgi:hypothetical protein